MTKLEVLAEGQVTTHFLDFGTELEVIAYLIPDVALEGKTVYNIMIDTSDGTWLVEDAARLEYDEAVAAAKNAVVAWNNDNYDEQWEV